MIDWLRGYQFAWLRPDVVAGLTTAAVVIPKALAYATVAGLSVQVGLYTAFLPMVVYALVGTSRPLSVSTTTTLAILTAAALGPIAESGDAGAISVALATLTLLVGFFLLLAGILRFGFVANFISEPVLIGFKAGIGLVIVLDQVPKLLGIHVHKGTFVHNVAAIIEGLPQTSLVTAAVAATMILLLVWLERFAPRLPAPLIAVAAGIVAMKFLELSALGVKTIGNVPTGLPSLTLPSLSFVEQLWAPAMGIALMSFTETIAAGRSFVAPGEPAPTANRELLATGFSNLVGVFSGAMPAGGGTSQTAVNRAAGARSQLAGLVTAAATLLTMLLLAPLISMMPEATLAAIVIVYSLGLIKPSEFAAVLSIRRTEFIWALVALAGVVLLGTLQGIVVAIIVSVFALAYQVVDPPVHVLGRKPGTNVFRPRTSEHPEDEFVPGLLLVRFEGRLFFANAANVQDKVRALLDAEQPKVLAFDLSGVFDIEYTALKLLIEAERRGRERDTQLWLVGCTPGVLEVIRNSPLGPELGRQRMVFTLEDAVARYESNFGRSAPANIADRGQVV